MNVGKLNKLVTIQVNTPSKDDAGFSTDSWATFIETWARLEPMVGREYLGGDQVKSDTTHKFIIRYTSGVLAKMRISWNSREFDIQSVINIKEQDKFLVLMAVERGL